jgi:hypothetical protein
VIIFTLVRILKGMLPEFATTLILRFFVYSDYVEIMFGFFENTFFTTETTFLNEANFCACPFKPDLDKSTVWSEKLLLN